VLLSRLLTLESKSFFEEEKFKEADALAFASFLYICPLLILVDLTNSGSVEI